MSEYIRRGKRVADLISDEGNYFVVELNDRRRVRWYRDRPMQAIMFGSLNPRSADYAPGGKVVREYAPIEGARA